MLDIYDFYDKMERNKIMLSFKGDITSELLTSILQIMESKLDNLQEEPKIKKKVYNVLVECLQNLYHHMDEVAQTAIATDNVAPRSAIFMIGKTGPEYTILTGNYILSENVEKLKTNLDKINSMDKEQLKEYYKEILNNDDRSSTEEQNNLKSMIGNARVAAYESAFPQAPNGDLSRASEAENFNRLFTHKSATKVAAAPKDDDKLVPVPSQ